MVHLGTAWYTLVQHSMVHFSGTICDFLFWCSLVVLGTLCEEILAFSLVRPTAWYTLVVQPVVSYLVLVAGSGSGSCTRTGIDTASGTGTCTGS